MVIGFFLWLGDGEEVPCSAGSRERQGLNLCTLQTCKSTWPLIPI